MIDEITQGGNLNDSYRSDLFTWSLFCPDASTLSYVSAGLVSDNFDSTRPRFTFRRVAHSVYRLGYGLDDQDLVPCRSWEFSSSPPPSRLLTSSI